MGGPSENFRRPTRHQKSQKVSPSVLLSLFRANHTEKCQYSQVDLIGRPIRLTFFVAFLTSTACIACQLQLLTVSFMGQCYLKSPLSSEGRPRSLRWCFKLML